MNYLISYDTFIKLSSVDGFNKINGETYQEYVAMALSSKISDEIKYKILNSFYVVDIFEILTNNGIEFTKIC
jgi:hypothetical protein